MGQRIPTFGIRTPESAFRSFQTLSSAGSQGVDRIGEDREAVAGFVRPDSHGGSTADDATGSTNRSGWGIRPKIRPVGSQTPATAAGEPFGLSG